MVSTEYPRISIVTVTYNASGLIRQTIESVLSVNYPNLEYIVIDGGSTDDTLSEIEIYGSKVDRVISEPDNGVFDAMNKGIRASTGQWLLFLNAGDLIYDKDIFKKIPLIDENDIALVYGNTYDIGFDIRKPFSVKSLRYGMIMACHQSMIFNRKILQDELFYSDKYLFYNDYELVTRISKKFKIKYVDDVIASYLGGGISSQTSWRARYDRYRMMFNLFGLVGIVRAVFLKAGYKHF